MALWQMRIGLALPAPKNEQFFLFYIICNRCDGHPTQSFLDSTCTIPQLLSSWTPVPVSRDLPLADDLLSLKMPGSYKPHSQGQSVINDCLVGSIKAQLPTLQAGQPVRCTSYSRVPSGSGWTSPDKYISTYLSLLPHPSLPPLQVSAKVPAQWMICTRIPT